MTKSQRTVELPNPEPTGIPCPKCITGEIVPTGSGPGLIYACEHRPACGFELKAKPTGKRCSYRRDNGRRCGALIIEGTGNIPDRCADKDCPYHRPDKL